MMAVHFIFDWWNIDYVKKTPYLVITCFSMPKRKHFLNAAYSLASGPNQFGLFNTIESHIWSERQQQQQPFRIWTSNKLCGRYQLRRNNNLKNFHEWCFLISISQRIESHTIRSRSRSHNAENETTVKTFYCPATLHTYETSNEGETILIFCVMNVTADWRCGISLPIGINGNILKTVTIKTNTFRLTHQQTDDSINNRLRDAAESQFWKRYAWMSA